MVWGGGKHLNSLYRSCKKLFSFQGIMNSDFTVDHLLPSLKLKHLPESLIHLVIKIDLTQKFPSPSIISHVRLLTGIFFCLFSWSHKEVIKEITASHQRQVSLTLQALPFPCFVATSQIKSNQIKIKCHLLHEALPLIPPHSRLYPLTLGISCSTTPELLLKLDYFLKDSLSYGVVQRDKSQPDQCHRPCCVGRDIVYILEALDIFAEWSWSWGRLESTQTGFVIIPVHLSKVQS